MLPIYDITTFTSLDYPNHLACIVWFAGCNMQCPYCYNPDIVNGNGHKSVDELMAFLKKRQGLLDGVVLSGGECTLYPEITILCRQIKELGYKIKIDTNGTRPKILKSLIDQRLIDYVALDYKAPEHNHEEIAGPSHYDNFSESLQLLIENDIKFEVRSTVHTDLIAEDHVNEMARDLINRGYQGTYYLQNYFDVDSTLGNINNQSRSFDTEKLTKDINIELRNF